MRIPAKKFTFGAIALVACVLLLARNPWRTPIPQDLTSDQLSSHALPVAFSVNECRDRLIARSADAAAAITAPTIRVLNWNIKKGQMDHWQRDLTTLAEDADLITIQEAVLSPEFTDRFPAIFGWSFSQGYRAGKIQSGVLTYSRSIPLVQCNFMTLEPWLGTPKATNITQYAISGRDETLLVVNMHAINYSFGISTYTEQLDKLGQVMRRHDGPIIISGDLNTWNDRRENFVTKLIQEIGLEGVTFGIDHRLKVFGHVLDYFYVRDLDVIKARTLQVNSSDHNPMFVELKFR